MGHRKPLDARPARQNTRLVSRVHPSTEGPDRWLFGSGFLGLLRISTVARYAETFKPADLLPADADTVLLYDRSAVDAAGNEVRNQSGNRRDARLEGGAWVQPHPPV